MALVELCVCEFNLSSVCVGVCLYLLDPSSTHAAPEWCVFVCLSPIQKKVSSIKECACVIHSLPKKLDANLG